MVDFDVNAGPLSDLGVTVVAASVDSAEETASLKEGLRIGWVTMASGVDASAVAEATGAASQTGDRTFLHATGFILSPEGVVSQSVYSSGPIGRFTAGDVVRKVRFEQQRRR